MGKQFIKSTYIDRKSTDDGFDKVIIVYKNEDGTKGKKVVEKPVITFYKTLPEFDDNQYHNYIDKNKVEECKVYNKDIYKGIAKELNDKNVDRLIQDGMSGAPGAYKMLRDVHLDRRLHGSDINVEDLYIKKFVEANPPEENGYTLKKGFYDIEVDGTKVDGFPEQEEALADVNIISYSNLYERKTFVYMLKYDTDTYKDCMNNIDGVLDEDIETFY